MKEITKLLSTKINTLKTKRDQCVLLDGKKTMLKKEGFQPLPQSSSSEENLYFIDGGNQELLTTPLFTVQKIRIACVQYKGTKRIGIEEDTYFALATNDKTVWLQNEDDVTRFGFEENPVDSMRKTLEYEKAVSKAQNKGFVIVDGNISSKNVKQNTYKKVIKQTNIVGITKTTTAKNEEGLPANLILHTFTKKNKIQKPYLFFLHEANKVKTHLVCYHGYKVLRLDLTNKDVKNVLESLTKHFYDPVFLGYPYGLVDADDQARITNKEVQESALVLKKRLGLETFEILKESYDSHDVLDSIKF